MNKPRVKPLVWEDFGERAAKANAMLLSNYLIDMWSDGRFEVSVSSPGYGTGFDGERLHASMSEAKAAAQADYEARILAALEPVTVQEAARIILDEVLQKSCPVAAEQRRTMVKACMKARIPSACSSARWTMVNDAIRALAEQDGK